MPLAYFSTHKSNNSVPGSGVTFVKWARSIGRDAAKLIVLLISSFVYVGKPIIKNPVVSIPTSEISLHVSLTTFLFNCFLIKSKIL